MGREELLEIIEELSDVYNFKWSNAYKLSISELNFLTKIISTCYLHGKCLAKKFSQDEVTKLVNELIEEEEIKIINLEGF